MSQAAYFEQRRRLNPVGLSVVVAMHAAGITALILAKGPEIRDQLFPPTTVRMIPVPPEPPPIPTPPTPRPQQPVQQQTQFDLPPPVIPTPTRGPTIDPQPMPPPAWTNTPPGNDIVVEQPRAEPPPPPPPPEPPRVQEAARARGSLQGLFTSGDYPAAAAESGDEGSTAVRLTIGTNGRVTACSVARSSGSSLLDRATCSVLRARARYTPARDQNNQPTTDTQSATISWRLSE